MAPPFVGRGEELAQLSAALGRTRQGRGSLVLVTGEAGIGKSRLAEEFAERACASGARVAWGRCWEAGAGPALWPWPQLLRALLPHTPPPASAAGWLAQLLPEELPAVPLPPALTPEAARFALFEAVGRYVAAAAVAAPLVLIIDDIHAADPAALAIAELVADSTREAAVVLLFTARDGEVRPAPVSSAIARLSRRGETLRLRRWKRDEVATAAGGLPDELVDTVHRRSGGNPLFVKELLSLLASGGSDVAVPAHVWEMVRGRLAPLPSSSVAVVELAAVVGRDVDPRFLARVADPDEVLVALDDAVHAGVLSGAAEGLRFSHILVRDAVYEGIPPGRRMGLHRSVAEALAALPGDVRVEEAAHHFELAGAPEAAEHLAAAARRAEAVLAFEEASDRWERALSLFTGDDERRMELLLDLGESANRAGRSGRARQVFGEARSLALQLDDGAALGRAALGLTAKLDFQRCDSDAVTTLEEALLRLEDTDSALRARLLAVLARTLYFAADQTGPRAAEEAVTMARSVGDPAVLAEALSALQYVLWGPGTVGARLQAAGEILALAHAGGDRERVLDCHMSRLICHLELADRAGVDRELSAYVRLAERTGQARYAFLAASRRAMHAFLEGWYREGQALADESRAIGLAAEEPDAELLYGGLILLPYWELGRAGELLGAFDEIVERYGNLVHRVARLLVLMSEGRRDELRAEFDSLSAAGYDDLPQNVDWMLTAALLAEVAAELGDPARAARLYDMLSPYAEQAVLLAGGVGYGGSVSYYLGRLAVALGSDSDAAAHYARAVEVDSAMGARPAVARALRQWGRYSGDAALVARAAQLMADMGVTTPTTDRPAAAAVTAVLRANGDGFVVGWDGQSRRLPSLRGLAYLARLVSQPGREVHVLDLTARPAGDSGTVLDDRAKEAYRRRLTDLQTDLEEAESRADTGQAERARAEIDALIDQLSAAVGLGGRDRRLGSEAERARTSVRRAVKAALDRVSVEFPGLGHHLTRSVVTGTYCCYRPDERLPVDWQT